VFAEAISDRGDRVDVWKIPDESEPPDDPLGYDAVIPLGASANPDQEEAHPWLRTEKALIRDLVAHRVPVLGMCLGAQLLAEAAGAETRAACRPEVGWYPVRVNEAGAEDPLIGPLAPEFKALGWHSYEFDLPAGAIALAASEVCLQAFRVGEAAWGVQFHAEVTGTDYQSWIDESLAEQERLGFQAAELSARTAEAIAGWNDLGRRLCRRFLDVAAARAARG
jgi:GMP synthase (glutamine-hydrolysing)